MPSGKSAAVLLAVLACSAWNLASARNPTVQISTDVGDIQVMVDTTHAPRTAANFLRYVAHRAYDNGVFHRTVRLDNQPNNRVKIEVIQGGLNPTRTRSDYPPIALERTNLTGIRHTAGTISMARDGPDTATSDFFICVADAPSLDFGGARNPDGQGFGAFGHVISGMDVVRRIQGSRADGQTLTPPVRIISIRLLAPTGPK